MSKTAWQKARGAARKGTRICKCECGGTVRGFEDFGQLWTWCEKCTPVVKISPAVLEGERSD